MGRGERGALSGILSSSRARVCEAEEPGEPCVPSVPTAGEFSGPDDSARQSLRRRVKTPQGVT